MEEENKKLEAEEPTEVLGNTDVIEPIAEEPVVEPAPVVEETPTEQPVVETPVVEEAPVEAAPEVPVEPAAEQPAPEPVAEPAPVETQSAEQSVESTSVVEPAAPVAEPKKKSKLPLILLLLIVLAAGGFAVWYFVLGGNGSNTGKKEENLPEEKQGKDESKEKEEQPEEKEEQQEEQKEEEPETITEVTEDEAKSLISKYYVEMMGKTDNPHCGMDYNLFKEEGASVNDISNEDRQTMIITNLKKNVDKNEFTLDEYIEMGKKLFGSKYTAKIAKNSGSFCSIMCVRYEYDENTKVIKVEMVEGGGSCSPGSYKYSFVSGKNNGKTITLEYKALFSKDVGSVDEFISSTAEEKGRKYVITFVKDGENFIFSKAE